MNTDLAFLTSPSAVFVILTAVGAVGLCRPLSACRPVGLSELSERRMTVTTHGHCRESLSGCRDLLSDYCRATVGLSGSVGRCRKSLSVCRTGAQMSLPTSAVSSPQAAHWPRWRLSWPRSWRRLRTAHVAMPATRTPSPLKQESAYPKASSRHPPRSGVGCGTWSCPTHFSMTEARYLTPHS